MNRFTSLLAATLLLASSSAWAGTSSSADLTYCLDMKSNPEIAKCAGEVSAGNKGKPLSREEVREMLSAQKMGTPASANESSGKPATASDKPGKDLAPAD